MYKMYIHVWLYIHVCIKCIKNLYIMYIHVYKYTCIAVHVCIKNAYNYVYIMYMYISIHVWLYMCACMKNSGSTVYVTTVSSIWNRKAAVISIAACFVTIAMVIQYLLDLGRGRPQKCDFCC